MDKSEAFLHFREAKRDRRIFRILDHVIVKKRSFDGIVVHYESLTNPRHLVRYYRVYFRGESLYAIFRSRFGFDFLFRNVRIKHVSAPIPYWIGFHFVVHFSSVVYAYFRYRLYGIFVIEHAFYIARFVIFALFRPRLYDYLVSDIVCAVRHDESNEELTFRYVTILPEVRGSSAGYGRTISFSILRTRRFRIRLS